MGVGEAHMHWQQDFKELADVLKAVQCRRRRCSASGTRWTEMPAASQLKHAKALFKVWSEAKLAALGGAVPVWVPLWRCGCRAKFMQLNFWPHHSGPFCGLKRVFPSLRARARPRNARRPHSSVGCKFLRSAASPPGVRRSQPSGRGRECAIYTTNKCSAQRCAHNTTRAAYATPGLRDSALPTAILYRIPRKIIFVIIIIVPGL